MRERLASASGRPIRRAPLFCIVRMPAAGWRLRKSFLVSSCGGRSKNRRYRLLLDFRQWGRATHKPEFAGEWVKLGDVCEITMGQSPDSSSYNADCEGLPFYQGNADFGKTHPTPRIWCSEPKKVAEAGDILISVRAPVGAINVADERCCIGRGLAAVRPSGSDISNAFLALILQSKRAYLDSMSTGSTFKAIGKKVLSSCEAPLYSHEVQSRIACQINGIDDCLRSSRKLLSTLNDLVKSQFVEMFGDQTGSVDCLPVSQQSKVDWARLGDVCEILNGYAFDSAQFNSEAKGLPLIRIRDVKTGATSTYTTESCPSRYVVDSGDLLIGMDGEFNLARWLSGKALLNQRVCRIRSSSDLLLDGYLEYALPVVLKEIENRTSFVTVKHLSSRKLETIAVALPPLALQQQFADFVARVDKLGFDCCREIVCCGVLFSSMSASLLCT